MNWSKILIIYKKELLDLFRDRRTIITSIILPIILYPFISIFVATLSSRQEVKIQESEKIVYVQDQVMSNDSEKLIAALRKKENINIQNSYDQGWNDEFKELLENNDIQAFLSIRDSSYKQYKKLIVSAYYNETDEKSQNAYLEIKEIINDVKWEIVKNRLSDIELSEKILEAIDIEKQNVAPPQKVFGALLGKFLAYMLIMLTISSGAVVASDLVAGEKERGTLETILVSAATRLELVGGKFLTIITFSFITVFMNLLSMYISTRHILGMADIDMSQIELPLFSFLLVFIAMIPLAILFASIQLSLSTYSRNIKECSSYQMPILIVGMMLSMISAFPGFDLNYGYAVIPIMNFSLLLKEILLGSVNLGHYLVVTISTLALAAIGIITSLNLFKKENILFRSAQEQSMKFWGKKKQNIFSPAFAFTVFIIVILLFYYVGTPWQTKDLTSGLIKTELLLVLLPVLIIYRISKTDIKTASRFNKTKLANFVLVILGFLPGFIIAAFTMQLINYLYPLPDSYLQGMQNLMSLHEMSLAKLIFVIAILPGFCEEMLFRGYIIRAFEKMGFWKAIVISGLLFGIFHLDFFRLLPASIMGIWLGYLLLKTRSIYITMLAHALHNSSTVLISHWGESIPVLNKIIETDTIPLWLLFSSLAVIMIIIYCLEKVNADNRIEDGIQS